MEKKTIFVNQTIIEKIKKICDLEKCNKQTYLDNHIQKYECVYCHSVTFSNGYSMDLKVCSADIGEPCWCEVVLFDKNNNEVSCSDVREDIVGEWKLINNNVTYILNVVIKN